MNVLGVIPVRMAATRFPGKPLAPLLGMPMVGHCYHRTRMAVGSDACYVATCDQVIADYVKDIGGRCVMTSDKHTRASTRTAEAFEAVERETGEEIDVVVMVQGDEPLVQPGLISDLLPHFEDPTVEIVNAMTEATDDGQFRDPNNVKVVVNRTGDALYFSREPIPSPWKGSGKVPRYIQTGIIAFRRDALLAFNRAPETGLEQAESIDMLRVLEAGGKVRMTLAYARLISVDTQEDLRAAEAALRSDPLVQVYLGHA